MVGTAQANRTGADVNEEKNKMKVGSYECVCFQHDTMPLCFAMWADNNIVKTLSNYHSPTILPEGSGVMRKKKGADGKREFCQSPVPCPLQSKDYSETFHLIDKGNGAEAKFDMGGHSKTHNWCPKLVWRIFNMGQNNAYNIYVRLIEKYAKGRRFLKMGEAVQEMMHAFCQRGEPMRSLTAEHPAHIRDLTNVFDSNTGRKLRSDAMGLVAAIGRQPRATIQRLSRLKNQQKKAPWRTHQNLAFHRKGKCCWKGCPGIKATTANRPRGYDTFMRCEECSANHGKDMFFCNNSKSKKPVLCHLAYHNKYHSKKYCHTTESQE